MSRPVVALVFFLLFSGCVSVPQQEFAVNVSSPNTTLVQTPPAANNSTAPAMNQTQITIPANDSNESNTTANLTPPSYTFNDVFDIDGKLIVHYFYFPGCYACKNISGFINDTEKQFENGTVWFRYNLHNLSDWAKFQEFSETYNLTSEQKVVPTVLFNNTVISDKFRIPGGLAANLSRFCAGPAS